MNLALVIVDEIDNKRDNFDVFVWGQEGYGLVSLMRFLELEISFDDL